MRTTSDQVPATALSAIADPDERWTLVGDRLERRSERRDHSVREQTYRQLKRAIVQCAIEPGAALSEQDLSEQLAVSRTPVREALLRLSDDGLVIIAPQRGTITTKISVRQVREAQLVREVLERSVLALASQRPELAAAGALDLIIGEQWRAAAEHNYSAFLDSDLSFHAALGALSGYDGVTRLATTARAHLDRVRALSLPETHVIESRIKDHENVLQALRAGDLKTADAVLTAHLRSVLQILPLMRERHPGYFASEDVVESDRGTIAITLERRRR
jgi:GntR family transcriptional regulator, rspAB operon transcriptional repressor